MLEVIDRYDEVFEIEMEGWCYGIRNYPGEIFPGLVHAVLRELRASFKVAIEHNVIWDLNKLSEKLSKACKYLVHEKEIAFCILANFPSPVELDEDRQFIMAQIIDQVEQKYGGALARLQRKWSYEDAHRRSQATADGAAAKQAA